LKEQHLLLRENCIGWFTSKQKSPVSLLQPSGWGIFCCAGSAYSHVHRAGEPRAAAALLTL